MKCIKFDHNIQTYRDSFHTKLAEEQRNIGVVAGVSRRLRAVPDHTEPAATDGRGWRERGAPHRTAPHMRDTAVMGHSSEPLRARGPRL